jgi:carbamoyl-phosphate synthase large subunit
VVDGDNTTPGPADQEILHGLEIRPAAVERGIPCITSIDTARAMVAAMERATEVYTVQPITEYRKTGTGY